MAASFTFPNAAAIAIAARQDLSCCLSPPSSSSSSSSPAQRFPPWPSSSSSGSVLTRQCGIPPSRRNRWRAALHGAENRSARPGPRRNATDGADSRPRTAAASAAGGGAAEAGGERVFFDGGAHYGDLVTNLAFGLTLVWLPLTFAAVFRALFLRYRFTDARVTIQSGLLGGDRKDFAYDVVRDVKVVPRFIGEWGDMSIELRDGTKVELKSVPKFREIAKYVEERAAAAADEKKKGSGPAAVSSSGRKSGSKKGFS